MPTIPLHRPPLESTPPLAPPRRIEGRDGSRLRRQDCRKGAALWADARRRWLCGAAVAVTTLRGMAGGVQCVRSQRGARRGAERRPTAQCAGRRSERRCMGPRPAARFTRQRGGCRGEGRRWRARTLGGEVRRPKMARRRDERGASGRVAHGQAMRRLLRCDGEAEQGGGAAWRDGAAYGRAGRRPRRSAETSVRWQLGSRV
uniref:Uncharacterized protein n=1 Tax=Setaria viridis TaxID=4556 RepID=A0A4U6V3U8_SETVI|nr:hypothetical protein SEVIR_4G264200v2 [Setaria viridis]